MLSRIGKIDRMEHWILGQIPPPSSNNGRCRDVRILEVGVEMTKKTKHCRRAGDKMFDMR